MNTRTNLIIVSAGLLLAIASATPSAEAQLVDPDFNGTPPLNTDTYVLQNPFNAGLWGAQDGARSGS